MKYIIILLIAVLFSTGCSLVNGPTEPSDTTKSIISGKVFFSVNIPRQVFENGDTLSISFQVKNISELPKKFSFSNNQQIGFDLIDISGDKSITYPNIVSPSLSSFTLAPDEIKEFNIDWLLQNNNGDPLSSGRYDLVVYLLDNNSPELKLEIIIN